MKEKFSIKMEKCANCGKRIKEFDHKTHIPHGSYGTSTVNVYFCSKECDEKFKKNICKKCHYTNVEHLKYVPEKDYMLCTESAGSYYISCYEKYKRSRDETIECLFCSEDQNFLDEFSINDTNKYYHCSNDKNCIECYNEMINIVTNMKTSECIYCKKLLNDNDIKYISCFASCNNCAKINKNIKYIECIKEKHK